MKKDRHAVEETNESTWETMKRPNTGADAQTKSDVTHLAKSLHEVKDMLGKLGSGVRAHAVHLLPDPYAPWERTNHRCKLDHSIPESLADSLRRFSRFVRPPILPRQPAHHVGV